MKTFSKRPTIPLSLSLPIPLPVALSSSPSSSPTHSSLPTYLATYLPAYLPTYLPTFLPTYLPTYLPICHHPSLPFSLLSHFVGYESGDFGFVSDDASAAGNGVRQGEKSIEALGRNRRIYRNRDHAHESEKEWVREGARELGGWDG
jgi:hypothetical protein